MAVTDAPTLKKRERINSKKTIDRLFGGGHSKSMSAFPLRAVYAVQERTGNDAEAQMMVSVPKRMFTPTASMTSADATRTATTVSCTPTRLPSA